MSQSQPSQGRDNRPTQVTMAGWVAVIGSTFLLLTLFDSVAEVRSVETREGVEEFLSSPTGEGLGLGVDRAVEILRALLLFSGAAYAAALVLGIFVLQRHRGARIGFTVTAVAIMLTAPLAGGFLPALVAFAAITLWTGPARDWFAGRTPAASGASGASGSSGARRTGAGDYQEGRLMSGQESQPDPSPRPADRPYGEPPSAQAPAPEPRPSASGSHSYGQPPPGWPPPDYQPPQQSQQGYYPPGYPPDYQQSYQPDYQQGYPQYGGYQAQQDPDRRPATVTIAAWLTWVFSALTLVAFVFVVIAVLAARDELLDAMRAEPGFEQLDIAPGDLVSVLWVVSGLFIFWCASAIVLAVLAYRRVNWARIMLVVSAGLTLLLALMAIGSAVSAVHLLVAGAVIVLLFTGGANQWYSRKGGFLPGRPSYPPAGGYGDSSQYGQSSWSGPAPQRDNDEEQRPKNVW